MKSRYLALLLLQAAIALTATADSNPAKDASQKSTEPVPIPVSWVKAGRMIVYNLQRQSDIPPTTVAYLGPGKVGRLILNGIPEQLNWIVRSEFPNGVDKDFITNNIIKLFSGFSILERPIDRGARIEALETAHELIKKDPALTQKLDGLMEPPSIMFSEDNIWNIRYQSYAGRDQMVICFAEGTLRPFCVIRSSRYSLLTTYVDSFDVLLLEKAIAAKNHALACEASIAAIDHPAKKRGN